MRSHLQINSGSCSHEKNNQKISSYCNYVTVWTFDLCVIDIVWWPHGFNICWITYGTSYQTLCSFPMFNIMFPLKGKSHALDLSTRRNLSRFPYRQCLMCPYRLPQIDRQMWSNISSRCKNNQVCKSHCGSMVQEGTWQGRQSITHPHLMGWSWGRQTHCRLFILI